MDLCMYGCMYGLMYVCMHVCMYVWIHGWIDTARWTLGLKPDGRKRMRLQGGETALMLAVRGGHLGVVMRLIKEKADLGVLNEVGLEGLRIGGWIDIEWWV